ncbi:MAG TPA: hypothetical protein VNZ45_09660 [Bacteroidia bacterium]|nr:hypothetical protein [Bacteroidia bacterium]
MTDAPNTSSYVLVSSDTSDLPYSRAIASDGGISISDTGGGGTLTIGTTGSTLSTLNSFDTAGFIVYDTGPNDFVARTLTVGQGLTITNPKGLGADPEISVVTGSTNQLVEVQSASLSVGQARPIINFLAGTGAAVVTVTPNVDNNSNDVNISVTGTAPGDATYIVQTATDAPTNAQVLASLSTGILKSTTTTGVLSIASPTADYLPYSAKLASINSIPTTEGTLIIGNGSGGFGEFLPSAEIGDILLSGGTAESPTWLPCGTTGEVLTSSGPDAAPTWQSLSSEDYVVNVLSPSSTAQVLKSNNTYIPTNTSTAVNFTFPASPEPGDFYVIQGGGFNSIGWTLSQTGSQTIQVGYANGVGLRTTSGSGGSLASVLPTDSVFIYCITATEFIANVQSGQITVT